MDNLTKRCMELHSELGHLDVEIKSTGMALRVLMDTITYAGYSTNEQKREVSLLARRLAFLYDQSAEAWRRFAALGEELSKKDS